MIGAPMSPARVRRFACQLAALACFLVACSDDDAATPVTAEERADPSGAETPAGQRHGQAVTLDGVEPALANAVAPYDAWSAADLFVISGALGDQPHQLVDTCLRDAGWEVPNHPPRTLHTDRSNLVNDMPAQFPNTQHLLEFGLPLPPAEEPSEGDMVSGMPDGTEDDERACVEQHRKELDRSLETQELFLSIADAWWDILAEVDASEEVRALASEFSDCLQDQGVPAEHAVDEFSFLNYIDVLHLEAGHERTNIEDINLRYGQMYAMCGQDLFEAREQLRSDERRDAFLHEHAESLRELSDRLYGAAATVGGS